MTAGNEAEVTTALKSPAPGVSGRSGALSVPLEHVGVHWVAGDGRLVGALSRMPLTVHVWRLQDHRVSLGDPAASSSSASLSKALVGSSEIDLLPLLAPRSSSASTEVAVGMQARWVSGSYTLIDPSCNSFSGARIRVKVLLELAPPGLPPAALMTELEPEYDITSLGSSKSLQDLTDNPDSGCCVAADISAQPGTPRMSLQPAADDSIHVATYSDVCEGHVSMNSDHAKAGGSSVTIEGAGHDVKQHAASNDDTSTDIALDITLCDCSEVPISDEERRSFLRRELLQEATSDPSSFCQDDDVHPSSPRETDPASLLRRQLQELDMLGLQWRNQLEKDLADGSGQQATTESSTLDDWMFSFSRHEALPQVEPNTCVVQQETSESGGHQTYMQRLANVETCSDPGDAEMQVWGADSISEADTDELIASIPVVGDDLQVINITSSHCRPDYEDPNNDWMFQCVKSRVPQHIPAVVHPIHPSTSPLQDPKKDALFPTACNLPVIGAHTSLLSGQTDVLRGMPVGSRVQGVNPSEESIDSHSDVIRCSTHEGHSSSNQFVRFANALPPRSSDFLLEYM